MAFISLLAIVAGLAAAPDTQPIRVTGIEQSRAIECDGRGVIVEGTDHDLTFTGACASLKLTGTSSKI